MTPTEYVILAIMAAPLVHLTIAVVTIVIAALSDEGDA